MTIASEIQDLQSNLQAAKSAVTTKGGTVTDSGLAGLATEIDSIPTGSTIDNYGSITYLDSNNVEQTLTLATEPDYLELTLGNYTGVLFTINNVTIDKTKITGVNIADGVTYIPDSFCYGCTNLVSATIPSSVHYIGAYVFYSCKIASGSFSLDNVVSVGDSFLQNNTTFNLPIILPKVREIGIAFLRTCRAFNSTLTINDGCEFIGNNFLRECNAFAQSFSIPSNLKMLSTGNFNPQRYFMYQCDSFTGPLVCNCPATSLPTTGLDSEILATNDSSKPMYSTGVTLTGAYAQAWKDALPDRTSSPYRKLIVGE